MKYRMDRVSVEPLESRPATWTFGGTAQRGTEQAFRVVDGNFAAGNQWEFIVRLPDRASERVEVRPRTTPGLKVWAELPDRSITFMRATLGAARGQRYCQVAIADATGERSRAIVQAGQKAELPSWFDQLHGRMRVKENVKHTRGTDGKALVLLAQEKDYATMIRIFFALKVWVLKEKFSF